MKLSESLRRGVIDSFVGGMINNFKIKSRRTTLFFEDILAEYIKTCEDADYGKKMEFIGGKWGALGTKQLGKLSMFQSLHLLNDVMTIVWSNLGLMNKLESKRNGNIITFETENEFITRIIGQNRFMIGFFAGGIISYYGKIANLVDVKSDKHNTKYTFKLTENEADIESKDKEKYNKLNKMLKVDRGGISFGKALKSQIFSLKDNNRIYFRKKSVIPIENTIFHIIGNENILMEKIPRLSYNFFREVVEEISPPEKKLLLLKTLLQTMGWGTVKIVKDNDKINIEITNLPIGLQKEQDNWNFLLNVILGYLMMIDKEFLIEQKIEKERRVNIVFAKRKK